MCTKIDRDTGMAALFRDNTADKGDGWPSGVVGVSAFVTMILSPCQCSLTLCVTSCKCWKLSLGLLLIATMLACVWMHHSVQESALSVFAKHQWAPLYLKWSVHFNISTTFCCNKYCKIVTLEAVKTVATSNTRYSLINLFCSVIWPSLKTKL